MSLFTCFGYGLLVNAATLAPDVVAVPMRLSGWRRAWRLSGPSSYGRRCTLTVVPDRGCAIEGVVIAQPRDRHVPILDDRARPIYPRAVSLSAEERGHIDRLLAELGAVRLPDGKAA